MALSLTVGVSKTTIPSHIRSRGRRGQTCQIHSFLYTVATAVLLLTGTSAPKIVIGGCSTRGAEATSWLKNWGPRHPICLERSIWI